MRIKLSNGGPEVSVHFAYYKQPFPFQSGEQEAMHTTAYVDTVEGEILKNRISGVAITSPTDNFCRVRGRKLALSRALRVAEFTKEQRREVWVGLIEKGMRV